MLEFTWGDLLSPISNISVLWTVGVIVTIYVAWIAADYIYFKLSSLLKDFKEYRKYRYNHGRLKAIDRIRHDYRQDVPKFLENPNRGVTSNDREDFPEVFQELQDTIDDLAKKFELKHISKIIWYSWSRLSNIKSGRIYTTNQAKKFLKLFKEHREEIEKLPKKKRADYNKGYGNLRPRETSTDFVDYPEEFKKLKDLTTKALDIYSVKELADKLKVTTSTVYQLEKWGHITIESVRLWIKNLENLFNNEEDKILSTHWLASQEELDKLSDLVELIKTTGMNQTEIALRGNLSQPIVSRIMNKQIVRRDQVLYYTKILTTMAWSTKAGQLI